ncbi:HAMP domain-containing protein [bacterium]|nr:HAMP domain-containing protein [bacterium]
MTPSRRHPTTRRLLTRSIVVLLGSVLACVTLGVYWQIQRNLEHHTQFHLRHLVADVWTPEPAARSLERPPHHPGHFFPPRLNTPLHLIMPDTGQQDWDRLASHDVHVRYYDLQLRKLVELGGPPERPQEQRQELQKMLDSQSESRNYNSSNRIEGWLMWSQLVRDSSGQPVGLLEMGMGKKPAEDLLHNLSGCLAVAGSLGLLVGIGMATMIARSVCRPLENIAAKMNHLSAGDFSVRAAQQGPLEMQTIAATFNKMVSELSQVFQGQRRFVADASHELKTPLTSIQTMVEVLRDHQEIAPDRKQRAFLVIERELNRVDQLVHDLLTLSRLEEPTQAPRRVDLRALVLGLASDYAHAHSNFQFDCQGCPLWINLVDPCGGERAIRNLLDNALAHTQEPGQVWLRLHQQPDGLTVEVADQGEGISSQDLPHVTRRFYRSDQSRSRLSGGSGLGLAIVSAWASRNGGRLDLQSELGKGTVVRMWLPTTS